MPVYKNRNTPVKQSAAPAAAPSTPEATTAAVDGKQTGGFLASLWTGTKNFFSSAKASIGTAFAATGTFIAANWAPIVIGLSLIAVVIGIAYYNGWIGKAVDKMQDLYNKFHNGEFSADGKTADVLDPARANDFAKLYVEAQKGMSAEQKLSDFSSEFAEVIENGAAKDAIASIAKTA